jgi:hypothetical protein
VPPDTEGRSSLAREHQVQDATSVIDEQTTITPKS